jgi:putative peptidoglycan lipid II flippase
VPGPSAAPAPPVAPAPSPYPPASASEPPTTAFVPPELIARRRAAAPRTTPYQPIAGWRVEPAAPVATSAPDAATIAGPLAATGVHPPAAGSNAPTALTGPASPSSPTDVTAATAAVPTAGVTAATGPMRTLGAPGHLPAAGPSEPSRRRTAFALLGGVAVVAVAAAVVVASGVFNDPPKTKPTAVKPPPAAVVPVALDPDITDFDPSPTGSGLKHEGKTWSSPTYTTRAFGNLKPGLGLILDLGSPRDLGEVTFDARTGPLTVDLRSADERPAGLSGWTKTGSSTKATGKTTLEAGDAGKHRYWMVWVSKLGFERKVEISDVKAATKG